MPFDADFAAAGLAQLLETLGEDIVYRPVDGTARTIRALVDRQDRQDGAYGRTPVTQITVLDDDSDGIAAADLDTARDMVDVAAISGADADSRAITRIVDQRPGVLVLEVR